MTSAAGRAAWPEAAPVTLPVRTGRTRSGPATRQTSLMLGPVKTAPRCARGTLHEALTRWGLGHLSEPGQAITSELVTNAIAASIEKAPEGTEPRPITLWVTAENGELSIRVWDPDPEPPPRDQPLPGDLAEHGRGLLIVAALSHRWGSHPAPNGGKYVWASLKTAPVASGDLAARFMPLAPARPERARHPASGHAGPCTPVKGTPAMFDCLTCETLRAAYDAVARRPPARWQRSRRALPARGLPLRPQRAGANARQWVPPDPEIQRRIKAALARI